jgi:dephospho-CoA kinase
MKVVGLTGGIGMGKSFAAAAFRRAGVRVFDADAEVHRLQASGGRALPAIDAAFPGVVRHAVLDRARLRAMVLADRAALVRLEAILHPMVADARRKFLARARASGEAFVVLDIPLLFERGGDRACDIVAVVSAPETVQRARVRARRKMDEQQISAVLAMQLPDAVKRRLADVVVRTGLSRYHAQLAVRRFVGTQRHKAPFLKKRSKKPL